MRDYVRTGRDGREWKDGKKEGKGKKHFFQTVCKILDPPMPVSQIN
jgi:hypothetical protein